MSLECSLRKPLALLLGLHLALAACSGELDGAKGLTDSGGDGDEGSGGSAGEGTGEDGQDDTGGGGGDWPEGAVILDHVHVLDALTDREDAAVILAGDEIWEVVDAGQDWPEDAVVHDLSGKTVIPGLIDAHVHLFHSGSLWWVGDTLSANLQAQLAWGVVGVADLGSPEEIFDVRDRIAAGELLGPRIWATGPFLTAEGSHPCETANDRTLCRFVDGDGAEQVAALSRADGLKVALADADFTPWPTPRLDLGDLAEIVEAADAAGQPVWAHVDELEDVDDALAAGVAVMAHPVFGAVEAEVRDAPLHSTFGAFAGVEDVISGDLTGDDLSWTPDAVVDSWLYFEGTPEGFSTGWVDQSTTWAGNSRANLATAVAEGRTILAGSDAGYWFVPHGLGLHRELEDLVAVGMDPQEAIAAATAVPADELGWTDLGYVAAGYRADLLVLSADPMDDIRNTRAIAELWLGGQVVGAGEDPWLEGAAELGGFCLDDRDCDDVCDLIHHRCTSTCDAPYDRTNSCDEDTWCGSQDGVDYSGSGVCQDVPTCDLYAQDCAPASYEEACVPLDTDTAQCWPSGPRQPGQTCSWDVAATRCEVGSFCSWVDSRCYELCDPDDPDACPGCTLQKIEGQPWFGVCL